ncbi:TatD family hydrolase [Aneurinibacillus thermoaerophilus]|jgi:TatD DNase family protein|uniref:TatD family hydrolase n=1 Tax=Aneurinibacillus thermoaerophilus TaxID=143495 RepID=A0ABX8Y806_ANETH|nr:TatD family hydrolase [Aneurinibacillus thermoaerophilus]QYY41516.1 TatD family hydrolase [Aneurinibacillus thermoaerophilus]
MKFIDFHVHIDHYADPVKVANEYEKLNIYALFVTNLPELFEKHLSTFNHYKHVRLALGYHPVLAGEYPFNRQLFDKLVVNTKYIGEVGIDLTKANKEYRMQQMEIFDYVTQPTYNKGRIYSVHSNSAEDEVLEILKKNNVKHAVFHWYNGKISTLKQIIDSGYFFSINYRMLTSQKGQKLISLMPPDRILFETDGPFIRYERKIIQPQLISKIYEEFNGSTHNFTELVFKNFKRLLLERDLIEKLATLK